MCGRFGLWARLDAIEGHYGAHFTFEYEPRYNIAPEDPAGIAAVQNDSTDDINRVQWGIVPPWVEDLESWPAPINVRAETVAEKPAFRDTFAKRRCLIPANNFYEWTGPRGSRRPYVIGVEYRELFSMAGIWESREANGDTVVSAAIITTDSNEVVGELHDRMPVLLATEEEQPWLAADDEEVLTELLDPYPDGETRRYEVSTVVNDPTYDAPELVEPLGTEQSGLGDFS